MKPRLPRHLWQPLLLCASLGALACGSLKSEPTPTPGSPGVPGGERPPAGAFAVTLAKEGPEFCREGTWTLTVSVAGGTPDTVELVTNEEDVTVLTPPYRHVVDCATHDEGHFTFAARAVLGEHLAVSPSVTVVVDRTPPTVEFIRPDVMFPSTDMPLEFVFSEPLRGGPLQASPAVLRDASGFSVAHQAVLSEDGKVLRLVPASPVRPPVTLHIELFPRSLTDQAGNPFNAGQVYLHDVSYWPFVQVGAWWWSESSSIDAQSLAMEQFLERGPVIAYLERKGLVSSKAELGVARWSGEAWVPLPPPREPHARTVSPESAQLETATRARKLVLAWLEHGDSTWKIHVMQYDGTSWARLGEPVDTLSQRSYPDYQLAVDAGGRPFIVYRDASLGLDVVRWNDKAWESLGDPRGDDPELQTDVRDLAITARGNPVAVAWSGAPAGGPESRVFVMEHTSQGWQRLGRPLRGTAQGATWRLAMKGDGFGNVTVAWQESDLDGNKGVVFVSRWKGGFSLDDWGPPEQVQDATDFFYLAHLALELDADGEPWVAWQRRGSGYEEAVYRRRRPTGWEPEQFIAGATLSGFRLDDRGMPWVSAGYPDYRTILRPQ